MPFCHATHFSYECMISFWSGLLSLPNPRPNLAGDQEKNISVAVGISYTEYYLNYAQFGMTAFSATSGTLRQVLSQWTVLECLGMQSNHLCSTKLHALSTGTPRNEGARWQLDSGRLLMQQMVSSRVTLETPEHRVSVLQRGVWTHQLHAGAEGAVSVHRHRMLIVPGRRSRLRHQLPANHLPKVYTFCITWESCHASPLHLSAAL